MERAAGDAQPQEGPTPPPPPHGLLVRLLASALCWSLLPAAAFLVEGLAAAIGQHLNGMLFGPSLLLCPPLGSLLLVVAVRSRPPAAKVRTSDRVAAVLLGAEWILLGVFCWRLLAGGHC